MTLASFFLFSFLFPAKEPKNLPKSIYDFKVPSLEGATIDFAAFKGKKILIVNTASKCGFTPQYKELETLYEQHKEQLVIVGFPANDFLFQEPKGNEEIAAFCQRNYGVSFPMSEKVSVKGKHIAPIYYWLTHKKYNGLQDSKVKWNFQKYLVDEKGQLIGIFDPKTSPMSEELVQAIEQ
jgi:glutathione peroxidase